MLVGGGLAEGIDTLGRAFDVADRLQRPFLAWMALNIRGPLTWGLGAPDEAEEFFRRTLGLPYIGKTAYRQQTADGVGRCHASRGELAEARRLLSDARPTLITHSLNPLVDLGEGDWDAVESLAARVLEASRRSGRSTKRTKPIAATMPASRGSTGSMRIVGASSSRPAEAERRASCGALQCPG